MALTNVFRQALLSGTMEGITQPTSCFRVMHKVPAQPDPACAEELPIGMGDLHEGNSGWTQLPGLELHNLRSLLRPNPFCDSTTFGQEDAFPTREPPAWLGLSLSTGRG